jgi:predicted transcriptional regulator
MPISEICNREVVIVQRHNTILEAAQLMRQHHVGDVVVVESGVVSGFRSVSSQTAIWWWKSWRRQSIRRSSPWATSW